MTTINFTTSKIEASLTGVPTVKLTSTKIEALNGGIADIHETSSKIDVLTGGHATVKVSTSKVEVLYSNNSAPPPSIGGCPRDNRTGPIWEPTYCVPLPRSRFHKFWATQINACPSEASDPTCFDPASLDTCASPGLVLIPQYDPTWQERNWQGGSFAECGPEIIGATISTDKWVRGLILNILGTNAQQAKSICGNRPGQKGGYWLDDVSGAKSGSSIRYIPTTGYTINQQVTYVQQQCAADLNKLITYGVANSVNVVATYAGLQTIQLIITVIGVDDETTVVNSTMAKIANAWVWNS